MKLITLIVMLYQNLQIQSQSIPVVTFQGNGSFSKSTYIERRGPFGQEDIFSELSICLRMSVFHLRGRETYFLSFANPDSSDALQGYIERVAFDKPYILGFCKHKFINYECVEHEFETFKFFNWHHICLTYEHQINDNSSNLVSMELYVDGTLVELADKEIPDKAEFLPLKADGILILGQEQDALGGFFDENQAYSGELSQVELWTSKLDTATISALAKCEQETAFAQSRVVTWNGLLDEWSIKNVENSSKPLSSLCKPRILQDYLIWAKPVTYQQISEYCQRLDGTLPEINENTSLEEVHATTLERFVNTEPDNPFADCAAGENLVKFWIRNPNVTMYSDISNQLCPYAFGKQVDMQPCTVKFPCGICKLPSAKRLLIKGICKKDVEYKYDIDFGIYGTRDGKPLFRGSQNSVLHYHKETKKWRLQSLRNPLHMVQTVGELEERLPIGTNVWEAMEDYAICKLRQHQTLELTISQCYPNKYTCNNGDCIDLSDKCNTELDCYDKSDEYYCDYLRFSENYAKELVPRDETGSPLIVYMNVSVLAFPFIETVNLKFTADYFLNLKWYDLRINFQDLNNVTALNSLSNLDKDRIWTPKLGFTNALGPSQTKVDELTIGVLEREDDPLMEDITISTEAGLFSGRRNAIYLTREYYQEYACRFDLIYYPFDTQLCSMTFEVQGKTDKYIKLSKDSKPGIEFLSSRKLVEYEIQMEALEFRSVNNVSQGVVKFVFRRNMEFHVTNTFLQTFLLTCVGYFSYYFDVDNFSDRIMVVLTTMLVVATINSSIQNGLPKTSYYKMIDWWLIVSMIILIFTMAFHTVLAHVVSKCTKKPVTMRLLSAKSIFAGRYNGSTVGTGPGITSVESKTDTEHDDVEYSRAKTSMTQYNTGVAGSVKSNPEDELAPARHMNCIGKIVYVVLYIFFNIVFWVTAITEYFRPAEEYINNDKLTF